MTDTTRPHERTDTIDLQDWLKLAGVAMTGGEAKYLVQSGMVRHNGEIETRRRRKLRRGDRVEVEDREFTVDF